MVDEANEYKPCVKPISVEVEFERLAPNVAGVNGKTEPVGHEVRQSVVIHIEFADIAVVEA
jgi:hypothetical protein